MQRVTNCIFLKENQILLLQKPRRGWWAIPGGKMEPTETVKESVIREYREETGLHINQPQLKGIYTFLIKRDNEIISEWMMFTFLTEEGEGIQREITEEGILKWHSVDDLSELPMAKGDRFIIEHAVQGKDVAFGTFVYTEDFQLLSYQLDETRKATDI
ncbi:8-oxo-dGTP diphosphatase [Caldibacillus lycopersici]|uniref:8-oxo-dGTP diphosphatase n=1 Tax=Perspicuibacillus lycopersici TaxID=1325689 RepID=A0AAE3IQX0_9BACI|nr:8-oxo-dGTP diphosphatase [Perspicuibacillus lycopersici]MCU9612923.1 8-oxo-dGTP diphosphatase [Perspicuibacillus lycopersici]